MSFVRHPVDPRDGTTLVRIGANRDRVRIAERLIEAGKEPPLETLIDDQAHIDQHFDDGVIHPVTLVVRHARPGDDREGEGIADREPSSPLRQGIQPGVGERLGVGRVTVCVRPNMSSCRRPSIHR
jgi:hypothetical protein